MTPDEEMRMAHLRDVAEAAVALAAHAIPNDCPGPCSGPLIDFTELTALWGALDEYDPDWQKRVHDGR